MNVNPQVARKVLLFALGMSLGATVGYFVGGLIVYKLNEKGECEDEEPAKEETTPEQPVGEVITVDGNELVEAIKIVKEKEKKPKKNGARINYNKVVNDANPEVTLEQLASKYKSSLGEAIPSTVNLSEPPPPYVITGQEYSENESFRKLSLTYYSGDATYADSEENVVENAIQLVNNAHLHFGELTEDPDVVYIRNENLGIDYEVTRVTGSYKVIVQGLEPDEVKKEESKPVEQYDDEFEPKPVVRKNVRQRTPRRVKNADDESEGAEG